MFYSFFFLLAQILLLFCRLFQSISRYINNVTRQNFWIIYLHVKWLKLNLNMPASTRWYLKGFGWTRKFRENRWLTDIAQEEILLGRLKATTDAWLISDEVGEVKIGYLSRLSPSPVPEESWLWNRVTLWKLLGFIRVCTVCSADGLTNHSRLFHLVYSCSVLYYKTRSVRPAVRSIILLLCHL